MRSFWRENVGGIVVVIIIAVLSYLLVQVGGRIHNSTAMFKQEVSTFLAWKNDSTRSVTTGATVGRLVRRTVEFEEGELPSAVRDSLRYVAEQRPGRMSAVTVFTCRDTVQVARMMAAIGRCMSSDATDWFGEIGHGTRPLPMEFAPLSFSERPVWTFFVIFRQLRQMQESQSTPGRYISDFLVGDSLKAARHYLGDIREGELPQTVPYLAWFPKWYLISLWVLCSLIIVLVPIVRESSGFESSGIQPTIGWGLTFLAFAPGWAFVGIILGVTELCKLIARAVSFNPVRWWKGYRARQRAADTLPIPRHRVPAAAAAQPTVSALDTAARPPAAQPKSQKPSQRWFFIKGFGRRQSDLRSRGVPVDRLTLPVSGENGLVFPENEIDLVAAILDIRLDPLTAEPTTKEHVYALYVDEQAEARIARAQRFASVCDRVREQYIEVVQSRLKDELATVGSKLEEHESRRREISREIAETEPQIAFLQQRSLDLRRAMTEQVSPEWLGQEFDHLCDLPEVKFVEIDGRAITVYTNMLYAEEETRRSDATYFELGEFELVLHQDGHVRMNNLTHKRQGKDHPGLMAGTGCLGNIADALPRHIAKSEYVVAIQMMIAFLTRDARGGYRAGGWKEVPSEVALAARARKRSSDEAVGSGAAAVEDPSGVPA